MLSKRKSVIRFFKLAFLFALYRKGPMHTEKPPANKLDTATRLDDEESAYSRIRCPLCRWQPDSSSSWVCGGDGPPEYFIGCGTIWNTFDTHGVCPGCDHQWLWTDCLSCENSSLHEAWYTDEPE